MTRDKWVVVRRRQGEPRVSPLWPGWEAWCELGGRGGIVTQIKSFDTHAEALAYADEQSRTVTVTLPPATSRAVFDAGRGYTTYVNWDVHGWAWLESDGGIFAITDHEREALALHLLAHHYRKDTK